MSDPIMLDMGTREIEDYHGVSNPRPAHYQSGGWVQRRGGDRLSQYTAKPTPTTGPIDLSTQKVALPFVQNC